MTETYRRLRGLVGHETGRRFGFLELELRRLGFSPESYNLNSPRGVDRHLVARLNQGCRDELWLTANYDTFDRLPSANNNASSVVALLGLSESLRDVVLPVNLRIIFFDAGLDPDLVAKRRRDPDFVPGSALFVQHMLDNETDFIENYSGAVVIQAVGKGNLCIFEKTGKKIDNSKWLNEKLLSYGLDAYLPIDIKDHSPQADNISFLKEGLEAAVLARYQEGSWHRMQTRNDDLTNVDVSTVDQTVRFLCGFVKSFSAK